MLCILIDTLLNYIDLSSRVGGGSCEIITYMIILYSSLVTQLNNYLLLLYMEVQGRQSNFIQKILYRGFTGPCLISKPPERSDRHLLTGFNVTD